MSCVVDLLLLRLAIGEPQLGGRPPKEKPIGDMFADERLGPQKRATSCWVVVVVAEKRGEDPPRARAAAAVMTLAAAAAVAVAPSSEVAEARLRGGALSGRRGMGESTSLPSSLSCCRIIRRVLEFHRFLTALSVRPGSIRSILDEGSDVD